MTSAGKSSKPTRSSVEVDQGGEKDILRILLPLIRRIQPQYSSTRIAFVQVGKKSPAHIMALEVYRGTRQADHVVTEEELLALL